MRHPVHSHSGQRSAAGAVGHLYARQTGRSPVLGGVALVALGVMLVGLTIALGG
jgi:hypothetical protein